MPEPPAPLSDGLRVASIVGVVLRFLLPVAAIPFAASWIADRNVLLLLLLRPGKEVVLLGGGLLRTEGEPALLAMLLAFLPLGVLTTVAFFGLGRAYADRFDEGTGPRWLTQVVPPVRLAAMQRLLARRGIAIAFVGRIVALPYTLLAAAAGTTRARAVPYLLADAAGGIVSFLLTVAVGYGLGEAYERGGVWFTVVGIAAFFAVIVLGSRWLEREAARTEDPPLDPGTAA